MRINQNVMANNASRHLSNTNLMLGKSLEKLSSGFRINRAADDAAGLVVAQGLRAQVSGLTQAARNVQDGISVVQTAEGALNAVHTMLGRMRDLSVQAANSGGNDGASRVAAQAEINALSTEITRVASSTRFGGISLLDGGYGVSAVNIGASQLNGSFRVMENDQFTITVGSAPPVTVNITQDIPFGSAQAATAHVQQYVDAALTASGSAYAGKITFAAVSDGTSSSHVEVTTTGLPAGQSVVLTDTFNGALQFGLFLGNTSTSDPATGSGGVFQIGSNSGDTVTLSIASQDATALGVGGLNVTTSAGATNALTALDSAISSVSTTRGDLGAMQNRFESMINNLQVSTENLSAAESRIRDVDMAAEMVSFTKTQVLMQAGTAMLAQANQVPQSILKLLG